MAKQIKMKDKEVKIILGGQFFDNRYLLSSDYIDYVVVGEGEVTLEKIVESEDVEKPTPGCLKKSNGKILDGGWREEIADLDSLSFPDYTYFNFSKYLLRETYPILFTRGCKWNCSFCNKNEYWKRFRARSAENIFSEILDCLSKYPFIRNFRCCDHSMNSDMALLSKLSDLIIKHDLKIGSFGGHAQINSLMLNRELLKKLMKAGFSHWAIGIQSGSDQVLRSMRRIYTADLAEMVLREMYNQGMVVSTDFIIGYPTESEEDFQQSLDFASRIKEYVTNINVCNTCHVGHNDLYYHPERYGIYTFKNRDGVSWESQNSTPEIRARRYRIMMEHLSSLGVSCRTMVTAREFLTKKLQNT